MIGAPSQSSFANEEVQFASGPMFLTQIHNFGKDWLLRFCLYRIFQKNDPPRNWKDCTDSSNMVSRKPKRFLLLYLYHAI